MKVQELRIGNYYQENGVIYKSNINDLVGLTRMENAKRQSAMKGVLLTDEIISQLGFDNCERRSKFGAFYKDGWYLIKEDDVYEFIPEGSSLILSKVRYLHELQNIFYALTKCELSLQIKIGLELIKQQYEK